MGAGAEHAMASFGEFVRRARTTFLGNQIFANAPQLHHPPPRRACHTSGVWSDHLGQARLLEPIHPPKHKLERPMAGELRAPR
jgi:hypothetical protein